MPPEQRDCRSLRAAHQARPTLQPLEGLSGAPSAYLPSRCDLPCCCALLRTPTRHALLAFTATHALRGYAHVRTRIHRCQSAFSWPVSSRNLSGAWSLALQCAGRLIGLPSALSRAVYAAPIGTVFRAATIYCARASRARVLMHSLRCQSQTSFRRACVNFDANTRATPQRMQVPLASAA